jgi:hypothetical protein
MLYLLDANVLIRANRTYYMIERIPEFWAWLVHHGETGNIKVPIDVYEEFNSHDDALTRWAKLDRTKKSLLLDEEADPKVVNNIVRKGYAPDLTDVEIEEVGRDPFLIAHALTDPANRTIITMEVSKPKAQRQNRKIPDVCSQFNVKCRDTFYLVEQLDFRTDWKP